MSRPGSRVLRTLAAGGLLVAGLAMPAGAQGAAAQKASDHYVELECDGIQGADGTLFFAVTISPRDGAFGGLISFAPGAEPFVDPPTFVDDPDQATTGTASTAALSADIPLLDVDGNSAGSAHVAATLAIGGDVQVIDRTFKNGNNQTREKGTILPLAITAGTATLPDGSSFSFSSANEECFSDETKITFWANTPTSLIQTFAGNQVSCDLVADGDVVGNLFIDVDPDGTSAFVDAFFPGSGLDGVTEGPIDAGRLTSDIEYFDVDTGDVAGNGSIDATFAATGEAFQFTLHNAVGKQRVMGMAFAVAGSLVAPGFDAFDLGGCVLTDFTAKVIDNPIRAPKPTSKAPANDGPAGAVPVKPKSATTEQTKNAAIDMEVPFACETFLDEDGIRQPIPIIKTVWFKLVGAGTPVTLDTAATAFDTVLAVYTKSGNAYVPVAQACVDDVPLQPVGRTLQAAVRFTPAAGTTYYIQVGGFPDAPNWGTLKLAVR